MLTAFSCARRSTILQQQFNRVGRAEHGSVALPGVIRSGSIGTESLSIGTMPSAQQQITMGQMHRGHMPPLVRAAAVAAAEQCSALLFFFPPSHNTSPPLTPCHRAPHPSSPTALLCSQTISSQTCPSLSLRVELSAAGPDGNH